jgi:hypothetical protein
VSEPTITASTGSDPLSFTIANLGTIPARPVRQSRAVSVGPGWAIPTWARLNRSPTP